MLVHHLNYSHSFNKSISSDILKYIESKGVMKRKQGRRGKTKEKFYYRDVIMSFDIETTQYHPIRHAFMFLWQFAIDDQIVITGRTWTQFLNLIKLIRSVLKEKERYMIFVHNLSYEFQFLAGIMDIKSDDLFAMDVRKVVKFLYEDQIEFRCSYILTNMSLEEFTYKMDVKHKKLSGEDFDYSKIRYPWSKLTKKEYQYGINDVLGLNEALKKFIAIEKDDLYTLPLTSTGFVRRDAKKVVRNELCHSYMVGIQPDYDVCVALHEAFRGGDTHNNRFYTDTILPDVASADRSSSYPDEMCNREFPSSKWRYVGPQTLDQIRDKRDHHYALLMRVMIKGNIHLKDPLWGFPYIPIAKCRGCKASDPGMVIDNGRVLAADYLEITITDVDLAIILQQYEFDQILFYQVWMSRYKPLPEPLRRLVIRYYKNKTQLKDVEGQENFYMKEKAKLNSIYGLMVQDNMKQMLMFRKGRKDPDTGDLVEWFLDKSKSQEEILEKYSKKGFLPYQWGVWITAWARFDLQEGIRLVDPRNSVYVDTDSVKYIGDIDFTEYNNQRIESSKRSGAYATDPHGVTHYMGVFEFEGRADKFISQGAKKYCSETDGKLKLTCAGVNKKKGAQELMEAGGIDNFRDGFTFYKSAGIEAVYNDEVDKWLSIDHHRLHITRNVYFHDSVYTLGKTYEYYILCTKCRELLTSAFKRNNLELDNPSDKNKS